MAALAAEQPRTHSLVRVTRCPDGCRLVEEPPLPGPQHIHHQQRHLQSLWGHRKC